MTRRRRGLAAFKTHSFERGPSTPRGFVQSFLSATEGLDAIAGCERLNDVDFNQVRFRFEDDATTDRILARVQAGGEAWMSGTTWDGRRAIRISVCNCRTCDSDVARTLAAFRMAAGPSAL